MNRYIDWHFSVQKGMYFDNVLKTNAYTLYLSNIIEDSYWNYALLKGNGSLNELSLKNMESLFLAEKRVPCVYLISGRDVVTEILTSSGYNMMFEESFMVFQRKVAVVDKRHNCYIKRVKGEKDVADFMDVFISAYGGEKTIEQPYGELDKTYYEALLRSFANDEKFYHFICYVDSHATSVATLCFCDGKGGIYNVGTDPCFRGKGFGSAVTSACIHQWESLKGDVLFLQTETGSAVEKWYQKMGFESVFTGRGFEKRL